jgi:hypothetical protein
MLMRIIFNLTIGKAEILLEDFKDCVSYWVKIL